MRMVTDPEFVQRAIQVYVSRSIAYIEALLDAGCDAIMTTDDYSDNRGPIMGAGALPRVHPARPRCARRRPSHASGRLLHQAHRRQRVDASWTTFVAAGIDGWHGIQPSIGMDLRLLKERYGGRCASSAASTARRWWRARRRRRGPRCATPSSTPAPGGGPGGRHRQRAAARQAGELPGRPPGHPRLRRLSHSCPTEQAP